LQKLKKDSIKSICVSNPKPAILFKGANVSFYYIIGFGLIEIIEFK